MLPIIIGSDKTQLTAFSGSHSAYPVYMTVGTINKHMRHQVSTGALRLIAYLPTLSPDESTMSEARARVLRMRLFHEAMTIIFHEVFIAARQGALIADPTGNVRLCFPIL